MVTTEDVEEERRQLIREAFLETLRREMVQQNGRKERLGWRRREDLNLRPTG